MPDGPVILVSNAGSAPGNIEACISQLSDALSKLHNLGRSDEGLVTYLNRVLKTPFDDQGNQFASLFTPSSADLKGEDAPFVDVLKETTYSFARRFVDAFNDVAEATKESFSTVNGATNPFYTAANVASGVSAQLDNVSVVLRTFFLMSDNGRNNLAGLFSYSIGEILPVVAREQKHLNSLRTLTLEVMEGCALLPANFIPAVPNLVVVKKLCEAEAALDVVLAELTAAHTYNRAAFGTAANNVCNAKQVARTGDIPAEGLQMLKRVFNLSDLQIAAISNSQYSAPPALVKKVYHMAKLSQLIRVDNDSVVDVYTNIFNFREHLDSIQGMGIDVVIKAVMGALKERINVLRTVLEADANNAIELYTGNQDALVPALTPPVRLPRRFNTVNQADLYAQLTMLCNVMQRTERVFNNVDEIMSRRSQLLERIYERIDRHAPHVKDCGDGEEGGRLDDALTAFFSAVEARLAGAPGYADTVNTAGLTVLARIDESAKYLNCVRKSLREVKDDTDSTLNTVLGSINAASAILSDIAALLKLIPQIESALKTCDIRRLVGTDKSEYEALDELMRALSCLADACQNPYVQQLVRKAYEQFKDEYNKRKTKTVSNTSMQETPATAEKVAVKHRRKRVEQAVKQLEDVIKLDVAKFCGAKSGGVVAPPSGLVSGNSMLA